MTPLSLARPLADLYDLAIRDGRVDNIGDLARRNGSAPQRFHAARHAGERIEFATLAAYAHAAGYVAMLRVGAGDRWRSCFVGDLDVTVGGVRKVLDELGFEMVIVVEPKLEETIK